MDSKLALFAALLPTKRQMWSVELALTSCSNWSYGLLLKLGGVLNDTLVAVDDVLLQLVGQHALNWLALVRLGDFVDRFGDLVVLESSQGQGLEATQKVCFRLTYV